MSKGTILILCGLPASGKTQLADRLEQALNMSDEGNACCALCTDSTCLLRVTFDLLLPMALEKKLIEQQHVEGGHSAWRAHREQVLHCVDCLVQRLLIPHHQAEDAEVLFASEFPDSPSKDNQTSKTAESILHQFLQSINFEEVRGENSSQWVILIDDNMYYQSMRYQYFQLARKYRLGFCQVHVKCSTATALQQNALRREGRVPDDVIVAMAAKMEEPDPHGNHWEKLSTSWDWSVNQNLTPVLELLKQAWESPVPPVEDREEEKEEARRICSASLLHQADQILRRLTASEMSAAKSVKSKDEMKAYAKVVSSVKAKILEEFRQGQLVMDWMELAVENARQDPESPLFRHVATVFQQRLARFR